MTGCWRGARGWVIAVAVGAAGLMSTPARSTAQRPLLGMVPTTGMPDTALHRLRWIEGTWRGDPVGTAEKPFFERYTFLDDSLIQVTFYADSTLSRTIGSGRIYHNGGRIFMEAGSALWVVVRMEPDEVLFVPDRNAPGRVRWKPESADQWLVTVRSSMSGSERVRMYQMHRIR